MFTFKAHTRSCSSLVFLRHNATSLNVDGSIPDEENEFFSFYVILPATLGYGIYSASNRNEYQK
jgi:hypothetical protein